MIEITNGFGLVYSQYIIVEEMKTACVYFNLMYVCNIG